jgi:hypothetical protein
MQPKLSRKTFDDLISEAFINYLNTEGMSEFLPLDAPNRNPMQVPEGVWRILIAKHLSSPHSYN